MYSMMLYFPFEVDCLGVNKLILQVLAGINFLLLTKLIIRREAV